MQTSYSRADWCRLGVNRFDEGHRIPSPSAPLLPTSVSVHQIGSDQSVAVFSDILEAADQNLKFETSNLNGALGLFQWIARYDLKQLMKIKQAPFEARQTNKAWRRCRIVLASLCRS